MIWGAFGRLDSSVACPINCCIPNDFCAITCSLCRGSLVRSVQNFPAIRAPRQESAFKDIGGFFFLFFFFSSWEENPTNERLLLSSIASNQPFNNQQ